MIPRLSVLAVCLVGFPLFAVAADPEKAGTVFHEMPSGTWVAIRITSLERLDSHLKPLVDKFGLTLPALGQFIAGLDGVDPTGELVIGIVQIEGNDFVPYMLLPVRDYKAFIHAGDGDAGMATTPLTLAGEELMATQRGSWALVTNPLESFDAFDQFDKEEANNLSAFTGSELLSLIGTRSGVRHVESLVSTRSESSYQKANRYRMLKRQSIGVMDLEFWKSLLNIYSNSVKRFGKNVDQVLLAVDVNDDHSVSLRVEVPQNGDREFPEVEWTLSEFALPNDRVFMSADGPWGSPWTAELVELYLDHFEVSCYDYGISYLRPTEFRNYRNSVTKLSEAVRGGQLFAIDPAKGKPVFSNSALLIDTADASKLIELFDEAVKDWNRMVESSQRQVDFHLGTEVLKVGKREGKRYTVDLADAFRQNNDADLRKIMNNLYGRNGMWTIDLLPLDNTRVLLSDLPDDLRDQLLVSIESTTPRATKQNQWSFSINPGVLQEWRNNCKRAEFGDSIKGWKPIYLECDGVVDFEATTHDEKLSVKVKVPADVVSALGTFWRDSNKKPSGS